MILTLLVEQYGSNNHAIILLTSEIWQLQSGCNHSTAYVDQWKG